MKLPLCNSVRPISKRRPPHGGRGLKFLVQIGPHFPVESPPTRGAWIEIIRRVRKMPKEIVAPHTGGVD